MRVDYTRIDFVYRIFRKEKKKSMRTQGSQLFDLDMNFENEILLREGGRRIVTPKTIP